MIYELILASQSPRRRDLLTEHGFFFRTETVKISEIVEENVNVRDAILKLAQTKGQAFVDEHKSLKGQSILVLSADTMVVLDNRALGKPLDAKDACETLTRLSDRDHEVVTAFVLLNLLTGEQAGRAVTTHVRFRKLTKNEISDYVATGEPMDKAGSYAIQGGAKNFVEKIDGSLTNVVGLPMEDLIFEMENRGWHVRKK
jgi:septum formation protein